MMLIVSALLLVFILPGTAQSLSIIWDESLGSPLPFTWDYTNFQGFNLNGTGTETLLVMQPDISHGQRTIYKNNLTYWSTAQATPLSVATYLNMLGDNTGLLNKGLEQAAPGKAFDGGYYWIMNWQTEKYVALNGKVDKLSKLILGQEPYVAYDKRTLIVGKTWDMGDGWTLNVLSIDGTTTPRQARLNLSKDGVKKDDRVVLEKSIYTFVEPSLAGETDVPVFVTYVDVIFEGNIEDLVQLRHTWLISESVTTISSSDTYGVFKDANVNDATKSISLSNTDTTITLSPNATINLMGNMNFNVIDDPAFLRFYPTIASVVPVANGTITGMVTNASSTLPIANAEVTAGGITALTDAAGNYSISIAPATYTLTASATGYIINMTSVTVASGATVTRDFALHPRVFDLGDVNSIPGIDVGDVLFTAQFVSGVRTPNAAQITSCDVNPIPGVDVGDVLFIAQAVAGMRIL